MVLSHCPTQAMGTSLSLDGKPMDDAMGLAVGARGILEVLTHFLTKFSEAPLRRWGPVRVQIPLRSGHQGCLCLCAPPFSWPKPL